MSKQGRQTKISVSDGLLQAEESAVQDNSLLPVADELERFVAIDRDLLEWLKERAEKEQDSRIAFNNKRLDEFCRKGKRVFVANILAMFLAYSIIVGGGIASVVLAINGLSLEGSILGGVTLVAAAGVFLRKNKNREDNVF
ncbi:MAG: hypothetical protein FWH18_01040 [Marinilabiliaceae bacterium]|nr:hypothetical protein [Marinilabiliaceae bacterium]